MSKRRIIISGASGLIGGALGPWLETQGYDVVRLVRRPVRSEREIFWDPVAGLLDPQALTGVTAVIHLAGENVAAGRWTPARKAAILGSRVAGTRLLMEAMRRAEPRPQVLISASATGFYGNVSDDEVVGECWPQGGGFLAEVCGAWESEARAAETLGLRVAILRLGIVLTPAGGMLGRVLPVFRLGLGGRLGSGQQGMSWIALEDALRAVRHVLITRHASGVFNVTAPKPVTNAEFTQTLGRVLRRPAFLPVPGAALRLIFGDMADEALLGGVQAVPERLREVGFLFRQPVLEPALRQLLGK